MKTIRFDQLRNEEWFFFDRTLHKEPFVAKKMVGEESWHMNSVTLNGTEKFMPKDAMVFPLGFDKSYLDEAEKKELEQQKREEEMKKAFWKNLAEEEKKQRDAILKDIQYTPAIPCLPVAREISEWESEWGNYWATHPQASTWVISQYGKPWRWNNKEKNPYGESVIEEPRKCVLGSNAATPQKTYSDLKDSKEWFDRQIFRFFVSGPHPDIVKSILDGYEKTKKQKAEAVTTIFAGIGMKP